MARPFRGRRAAVEALGERLGDHHDLAVLRSRLEADPDRFGRPDNVAAYVGLIERRQAELAAGTWGPGQRLFAEPPGRLMDRWAVYWACWRDGATKSLADAG